MSSDEIKGDPPEVVETTDAVRAKEVDNMGHVMHEEDERVVAETGPEEFECDTDAEYWLLVRDAHLLAARLAEEASEEIAEEEAVDENDPLEGIPPGPERRRAQRDLIQNLLTEYDNPPLKEP